MLLDNRISKNINYLVKTSFEFFFIPCQVVILIRKVYDSQSMTSFQADIQADSQAKIQADIRADIQTDVQADIQVDI